MQLPNYLSSVFPWFQADFESITQDCNRLRLRLFPIYERRLRLYLYFCTWDYDYDYDYPFFNSRLRLHLITITFFLFDYGYETTRLRLQFDYTKFIICMLTPFLLQMHCLSIFI